MAVDRRAAKRYQRTLHFSCKNALDWMDLPNSKKWKGSMTRVPDQRYCTLYEKMRQRNNIISRSTNLLIENFVEHTSTSRVLPACLLHSHSTQIKHGCRDGQERRRARRHDSESVKLSDAAARSSRWKCQVQEM